MKDMPVVTVTDRPALGCRSAAELEVSGLLDQSGCRVIEALVNQAVHLVALVHDTPRVDRHYSVFLATT
jgi:hypothetical protein